MKIKIYTMTHRAFQCPEDEIYIPLHVGRRNAEDLGYQGDDMGENISELNPYYGELTGLYWIWKNETDADVIGICHYRRYFLTDSECLMVQEDYEAALADCDVLISELLPCSHRNNWESYANTHNISDMRAVGDALRKLYPGDYPAFCEVMEKETCCFGNLMVTSRGRFNEYCSWLFSIFDLASKKIDVSGYDAYHKRVYGFLSEMLLYVWIIARGYRWKACQIGLTSEKAETVEFKDAIGKMIAQGDLDKAKKTFYTRLRQRPDIRSPLSDITGEVAVLERILYILHEERRMGEAGFLALSQDMQILIMHYKNVRKLVEQHGDDVRKVGAGYFSEFPVSNVALKIIGQDVREELSLYEYLNEGSAPKKVSVIMSVCNTGQRVAESVGNFLNQTLPEIELLLIDNHSTDGSRQILTECQRQYPEKVRIVALEERCAEADVRRKGVELATGEYVAFAEPGDIPDVTMYEKLYTKAREAGCDVVECDYIDSSKKRTEEDLQLWNKVIGRELCLKGSRAIEAASVGKVDEILYHHR